MDMARGNFSVRKEVLKEKAAKLRNKSLEGATEYRKKAESSPMSDYYMELAKEADNMAECYEYIWEQADAASSDGELRAVEWSFNEGKLRSDSEIKELQEKVEQEERQVKANVHAMSVELDEKVQAMRARVDFLHGWGFVFIPLWTLVLEGLFFLLTAVFMDAFYMDSDFFVMYIPFLVPGAATYMIFTVVHKCIVNHKIRKLYEEGGAKMPPDISQYIEIGAIGWMLFGGKKR